MVKCGVFFAVRTEFLNIIDELRLQRVKYALECALTPKEQLLLTGTETRFEEAFCTPQADCP
jgi:hypothetical protein